MPRANVGASRRDQGNLVDLWVADEFEDTFVKIRPSDGAQVFFFRGGLVGRETRESDTVRAGNPSRFHRHY